MNSEDRIVPMRLQKFLARAGAASRRGSENLMTAGRVTVNGEVVTAKVVIEQDASGINDITADVPTRKKGIFTVQGVKQTQSWNELPAGIGDHGICLAVHSNLQFGRCR